MTKIDETEMIIKKIAGIETPRHVNEYQLGFELNGACTIAVACQLSV